MPGLLFVLQKRGNYFLFSSFSFFLPAAALANWNNTVILWKVKSGNRWIPARNEPYFRQASICLWNGQNKTVPWQENIKRTVSFPPNSKNPFFSCYWTGNFLTFTLKPKFYMYEQESVWQSGWVIAWQGIGCRFKSLWSWPPNFFI